MPGETVQDAGPAVEVTTGGGGGHTPGPQSVQTQRAPLLRLALVISKILLIEKFRPVGPSDKMVQMKYSILKVFQKKSDIIFKTIHI